MRLTPQGAGIHRTATRMRRQILEHRPVRVVGGPQLARQPTQPVLQPRRRARHQDGLKGDHPGRVTGPTSHTTTTRHLGDLAADRRHIQAVHVRHPHTHKLPGFRVLGVVPRGQLRPVRRLLEQLLHPRPGIVHDDVQAAPAHRGVLPALVDGGEAGRDPLSPIRGGVQVLADFHTASDGGEAVVHGGRVAITGATAARRGKHLGVVLWHLLAEVRGDTGTVGELHPVKCEIAPVSHGPIPSAVEGG